MRGRVDLLRNGRALVLLTGLLTGCATTIAPVFEAARSDALRAPPPVPDDWEPDAVLTLSSTLVQRVIDDALQAQPSFQHRIQLASPIAAVPTFTLTDAELDPGACPRCVRITANLSGSLALQSGLGDATIPASAHIVMDGRFTPVKHTNDWAIFLNVESLVSAKLDLPGNPVLQPVAGPLVDWFKNDLLGTLPPIELASVGGQDWPVRAMRAHSAGHGSAIQIELLSSSPSPSPIATDPLPPKVGWRLELSPQALSDLARRAAFERGELSHSVYADPTGLRLTGDRFELDLRLWRLHGRGWWRDFEVKGTVSVDDGAVHLEATDANEVAHSRGAALADPLAALVEGRILKGIESALSTSLPALHRSQDGATEAVIRVVDVAGHNGVVRADGRLRLSTAPDGG